MTICNQQFSSLGESTTLSCWEATNGQIPNVMSSCFKHNELTQWLSFLLANQPTSFDTPRLRWQRWSSNSSYDEVSIEAMKLSVIDLISYNICPILSLGVLCNDHDISMLVNFLFFWIVLNFFFAIFTTTMQYPSVPWQLQHTSVE
jgi:hypothetical protein